MGSLTRLHLSVTSVTSAEWQCEPGGNWQQTWSYLLRCTWPSFHWETWKTYTRWRLTHGHSWKINPEQLGWREIVTCSTYGQLSKSHISTKSGRRCRSTYTIYMNTSDYDLLKVPIWKPAHPFQSIIRWATIKTGTRGCPSLHNQVDKWVLKPWWLS